MGLLLSVGSLAYCRLHDPEGAVDLRKALVSANRTLAANSLPRHVEPKELPPIHERFNVGSLPYGWFDQLRRAVAYARNCPKKFKPLRPNKDAAEDPWVVHELCTLESHLICHSDCDGLYVPVDFDAPLYSERESDIAFMGLGSSFAGLRELHQVAPLLDIALTDGHLDNSMGEQICREKEGAHPFEVERKVWLAFFEAFTLSIAYKSAVLLT
jgi:hypothetical protein